MFLHVRYDGSVTIVCHRSEMGQGVRSTLPVLIADELGADMREVTILQGDADKAYGDQNTDGSSSVRKNYEDLRRIGATARVMLVAAAAKQWGVKEASCTTRNHMVVHVPTGNAKGFATVVSDASKLKVPEQVRSAPTRGAPTHFRDLPLLDGPDIVTGKAKFGADVKVPGMLVAVIARPPVVGGKAKSFDPQRRSLEQGRKKVFELPRNLPPFAFQAVGGVAVIAEETWERAAGARGASITWDDGPNGALDSAAYREELFAAVRAPGDVVRKTGDVDAALAAAEDRGGVLHTAPRSRPDGAAGLSSRSSTAMRARCGRRRKIPQAPGPRSRARSASTSPRSPST